MWIKLFAKHILRSIKLRPLQPVLSVLILTLSFALAASSLNVYDRLTEETYLRQAASYGRADITVTLNSRTENRFMQPQTALSALNKDAAVAGSFELPLFCEGGETAAAAATDFEQADGMFDFEFTAYGAVTEDNADESAFVTQAFAERHGLSVGDALRAEVLGHDVQYTVQGISPHDFMGNFSVMIPVKSVVRALAASSPFIAALGEDFGLCTTIYIDTGEQDAAACADALRAMPDFADKTVTIVSDLMAAQANLSSLSSMIHVLVIFIAVVAAAVVLCCFYILSMQRAGENALFELSGAPPRALLGLQCAEILMYWLAGSVAGAALTCAVAPAIVRMGGFAYATSPFGGGFALGCLEALGVTGAAAVLTALGFYFAGRIKVSTRASGRRRGGTMTVALLGGAAAACALAAALTPTAMHAPFAVAAAMLVILFAFVAIPPLFRAAMRALSAAADGGARRARCPALICAVKNARTVKTLHNSCRLLAILAAVCAALAAVTASGEIYIAAACDMLPADYVLLNAGENAIGRVRECDGTGSAVSLYWGSFYDGTGGSILLVSAEDYEALAPKLRPSSAPRGDCAAVTAAYARLHAYSVGDDIAISVDGERLSLKIAEIFSSPVNAIFFDSSHFGMGYNILSVTAAEGADAQRLRTELAACMAPDMAVIMTPDEFFEQKTAMFDVYITCGYLLFACMAIFSAAGLADNLYESYRARRQQFALFASCGMRRGSIAAMKAWETALTVALALAAGALAGGALLCLINLWMQSYSVDLFALLAYGA